MAIWHCSHPNIAMLVKQGLQRYHILQKYISCHLSVMSNIYHEGCPLYRTLQIAICNLLLVPIAIGIISRLLAKQPRSKVLMVTCTKISVDQQEYCSLEPLSSAAISGEPSYQYDGWKATPRKWRVDGLNTACFSLLEPSMWCV